MKIKKTSDGLDYPKYLSQSECPFKIETLGINKWLNEELVCDAAEKLFT